MLWIWTTFKRMLGSGLLIYSDVMRAGNNCVDRRGICAKLVWLQGTKIDGNDRKHLGLA